MRLAAGLCPDPLGELEHSPRPPSHNWGCLLLREEGREGEKGRKGMGRGKGGGMGGEGGKGIDDLHSTLFLGPGARRTPRQLKVQYIVIMLSFALLAMLVSATF